MDKWSQYANTSRRDEASGKSIFLDSSGSDLLATGSPQKLYASLGVAAINADPSGGDVLVLRPGVYKTQIITTPMTLRATRNGPATIQKQ